MILFDVMKPIFLGMRRLCFQSEDNFCICLFFYAIVFLISYRFPPYYMSIFMK